MDAAIKDMLRQSPHLQKKRYSMLIIGYVQNLLKDGQNYEHEIIAIIFGYFDAKKIVFKWNRNIRHISQCSLHEFLYVLNLGVDSLNNRQMTLQRPYPIEHLVRVAIKNDINGSRFNELNKFECCMLFCETGPLKASAMLKLNKIVTQFNLASVKDQYVSFQLLMSNSIRNQ
mmetsp:Transcript_14906/g.13379  ORF Transcript_14906/g.13379 Transcript_14906/m.13379 type:complete len:172 (-) Transcript_14906:138-653(-)